MLRSSKPANLRWLKLTVADELPRARGLFCANFILPEPTGRKLSSRAEKEIVRRLLQLGIPYAYLPHSAPGAAGWNKVAGELAKLVREKRTLSEFPSTFHGERLRGSKTASSGTIVWDDPMAVPVSPTGGALFG